MKHTKHKNRKSFSKWAMAGQRVMTQTIANKIVRRKVGKMLNGRIRLTSDLLASAWDNCHPSMLKGTL